MHSLAAPRQQAQEAPNFDSVYAETNFHETSDTLEAQRVQVMQVRSPFQRGFGCSPGMPATVDSSTKLCLPRAADWEISTTNFLEVAVLCRYRPQKLGQAFCANSAALLYPMLCKHSD